MSKQILLTNSGQKATCDDDMYETLMKYEWYLADDGSATTLTEYGLVRMEEMVMFGEPSEKNIHE